MAMLFFACVDPQGTYQECNYGAPDIDSCFEALTQLVNTGWQLQRIDLLNAERSLISLPVGAFDGVSLSEPLQALQQEWEQLLKA
ncbi:hypothetical protein [Spirosoma endophyticum]|uniref:Uncharacterized protein n=1 Tax=Spirosoma endophyticum TaxID=662367 RepID=A0A1I2HI68_9BACT|nr:hypothetical protein [Spirosoma endophyticum]SFF29985.1 hypothetical protein SAMN05216167_14424 [Spirosoma endophyticum]